MANFDVAVRRDYRDIAGLVLDARPGGQSVIDGRVARWANEAPLLRGEPRFGDLLQDDPNLRPYAAAPYTTFRRADATYLKAALVGSFGAASEDWTFAFGMDELATTGDQIVFASQNDTLRVYRRRAGVLAYTHNGAPVAGGVTLPDGTSVLAPNTAGTLDWFVNNVALIAGGAFTNVSFPANTEDALLVGRRVAAGDELDAILTALRVWRRKLSPLERDFAYQTMGVADTGASLATQPRMNMEAQAWTDRTGDPDLEQHNRLNPLAGKQHRFALGRRPNAMGNRVQIAAEVGGLVLPDTGLGGDLFSIVRLETPNGIIPLVAQDAGWSAVFDVVAPDPGHYSFVVSRTDGGKRIVRFDVA